ncbi:unnamed protein product [Closterium sp. Yama58-4]|nr:unnamed protein product [Closterium sp. Yama58-4]
MAARRSSATSASHARIVAGTLFLLAAAAASNGVLARHHVPVTSVFPLEGEGTSPPPPPPPPPPPVPATCMKSKLTGYSRAVALSTDGLFLFHWTVTKTGMNGALEAKKGSGGEKGWLSIGWTQRANKMNPGDAIVGNVNLPRGRKVAAYVMNGKSMSKINETKTIKLTGASILKTSARTIFKFTRVGGGGLVPPNYKGLNNMTWGFANTQSYVIHTGRGSLLLDLACKV